MRLLPISLVLFVTLALAPARAQQATGHEQHHQTQVKPQASGMMDHDKMMADMKAADARLESLVEQMKSAQGDAKITVMQNLLTELVQNQVQMHQHMATMSDHMMSQMPKK